MSLQGPRLDGMPQALPVPGICTVTGLLAGALGIGRDEADRLQALHDHLRVGVVVHRRGVPGTDFQTTDLSQPHLRGPMWMAQGRAFARGATTVERHVQLRPYLYDADLSVVVDVDERAGASVESCAAALERPRWMRHLGRSCCPPDRPILEGMLAAGSLAEAVARAAESGEEIWLPASAQAMAPGDVAVPVPDRRDWSSRRHGGETLYLRRLAA
jgi:CRISPR-associated protein Cas5/CasD subtype I-E